MKLSSTAILALAISSITATAYAEPASQEFVPTTLAGSSAQSEAKGFIDGQSLGGTTRNWYANELRRRDDRFSYVKTATRTPRLPFALRRHAGSTGCKAPSSTTPRASPKAPWA